MIRLGLDLHGVIDAAPELFSDMAKQMRERGHQIFIVTGREDNEDLHNELKACGIEGVYEKHYNSILSITSYQKACGTAVAYLNDDLTQPMMDPKIWNPTKAMLCATAGIDIMIDDSAIYEPFFRDIKTHYIRFTGVYQEFLNFLFYSCGHDLRL